MTAWLDASSDNNDPTPHPYSLYEDDAVKDGSDKRTLYSDIHALARLIWAMAQGRHFTIRPDLSKSLDTDIFPPEFEQTLRLMLDDSPDLNQIKKALYALTKQMKKRTDETIIRLSKDVMLSAEENKEAELDIEKSGEDISEGSFVITMVEDPPKEEKEPDKDPAPFIIRIIDE